MPYERVWVAPKVFVEHNGVKVYHAYKGGRDYPMHFWFTLSPNPGAKLFDVRKLPTWPKTGLNYLELDADRAEALRAAIDNKSIFKAKLWPGEED